MKTLQTILVISLLTLFSCSENNTQKEQNETDEILQVFENVVKGNDYNLVNKHFISEEHLRTMPGFEGMDFKQGLKVHIDMVRENIADFCKELSEKGIDTTKFSLKDYSIRIGPNSKIERKYILDFKANNLNYQAMGIVLDNHTQKVSFGLDFDAKLKR